MQVGAHDIDTSNVDKVLFPNAGITKGGLIDYYAKIADVMVPHLRDRPVAMQRFPDGIDGEGFFQKTVPDYFPDWIERVEVERGERKAANGNGNGNGRRSREPTEMVLVNDAASLVYLANQACISPHVWLSRRDRLEQPDRMILDLDPPDQNFEPVVFAARALREFLEDELGIHPFLMTTGSRGVHVIVPLRRGPNFDEVRETARAICDEVTSRHPEKLTTQIRKDQREGRLFLDFLRNAYAQHGIAPYAVRPLPDAPVATPIDWDELGSLKNGSRSYTLESLPRRLAQKEDPLRDVLGRAVTLPTLK